MKRIVVFNKMDLCNTRKTLDLIKKIEEKNPNIKHLHTSTKDGANINKLVRVLADGCPTRFKTVGAWVMIGGMPNIGKSTLINCLRTRDADIAKNSSRKSGAKTGA